MQETGDIDTIFSALSYEQKEALIRLPFRVGVWISSSDSSGGAESEARELRALETVIASYAEEYLKSEFVQKLMEKTFAGKAGWSGWTQGIETVPEDCARLMSSLETLLPVRELDAFRENLVDIAVGIDGSVGVRRLAVLLEYKPRFGGGTRRGTVGMACQLGENAPHGAGLQGYDNFGARLAAHAVDHGQIAIQQRLVEDVARRRQLQEVNHRNVFNWIRSLVPSARKRCCPARRRRSKRCKNSKLPAKP